MNIISFKDLRQIIIDCCTTVESNDVSDRYGFAIDFEKMESIFNNKKYSCHPIAFAKKLYSKIPGLFDMQYYGEYTRDPKEFETMFNGKSNSCEFMIFNKCNADGPVQILNEMGETELTNNEIFIACNDEECLNDNIILSIVNSLPIYRILVIREFDYQNDKYDYKIYIRSNYEMVTYFKQIQEKSKDKKEKN